MSDAPKIVYDRLRAAAPREAHPDADLLTAFAEQALSGAEREGILRHLARCGDCREIVALGIPASVEVAARPEAVSDETSGRRTIARSQAWFAWPHLRWAALAAGVTVVASVMLLRPGQHNESIATEKLATQRLEQAPAAEVRPESVAPSATQLTRSDNDARGSKSDRGLAVESRTNGRDEQMLQRSPARTATPPAYLADNKRVDLLEKKEAFSSNTSQTGTQPSAPAGAGAKGEIAPAEPSASASVSDIVDADATANKVQPMQIQGRLVAKNDAPALAIAKAKPAAQDKDKEETTLKSQVAESAPVAKSALSRAEADSLPAARQKQLMKLSKDAAPQWSLAQGKLVRSQDAGSTWQIALQAQQQLLSFGARGSDVWAGGQDGTLFHSADGGTTWTTIRPATQGGALTGDIVAIEIRSAAEVLLSTKDGESWVTADAGKTWEKR